LSAYATKIGRSLVPAVSPNCAAARGLSRTFIIYYRWSKKFLDAGKKRLAGDTAGAATSDGQGAAPGGQCAQGGGGRADARESAAEKSAIGIGEDGA
jgi:hypothetical protein